jgi:hypothetical protein
MMVLAIGSGCGCKEKSDAAPVVVEEQAPVKEKRHKITCKIPGENEGECLAYVVTEEDEQPNK